MRKINGFSLAELLLALLILVQIATFTIPKVLTAQQSAHREAVLKETIATLNTVIYQGLLTGQIYDNGDSTWKVDWVLTQVNAIKVCNGNSNVLGCNQASGLPSASNRGFVLPNGAVITGTGLSPSSTTPHISIDWNGAKGPNLACDDWIGIYYCRTPGGCNYNGEQIPTGQIRGQNNYGPSNDDCRPAYNALFN